MTDLRRSSQWLRTALLTTLLSGVSLGAACTCFAEEADASDGQKDHTNKTQRPVIAVVQVKGGELTLLIALLEERLSRNDRYILVDREHIDKVVKEQELGMLSAASSVSERIALSRLLGADLLVLLSKHTSPRPHCGIVISETSRGLRLQVSKLPTTDEPEKDSQAIQREIENALKKKAEPFTSICAVPPFLSGDLTRGHDHLQAAYARLIEQMFLKTKGMVVVELAEARAIAREIQLSGRPDGPKRKLPLYVLGEYRHSGNGKERRVAVSLTLKRGEKVLGRLEQSELAPTAVPAFLREFTQRLVTKATGQKMPPADPAAEARLLAERAETFRRIGNWTEALALYEASLLLDPDREAVRRGIVSALTGWLTRSYGDHQDKPEDFAARAAVALDYYRLGLPHVEWLMRSMKLSENTEENWRSWDVLSNFLVSGEWFDPQRKPDQLRLLGHLQVLYRQVMAERREMLFRVLEYRMRKGNLISPIESRVSRYLRDNSAWFNSKDAEENYAIWLRALRIIADYPKARGSSITWDIRIHVPSARLPEIHHARFRRFLQEMSQIPSEGIRQAAADVRKRYEIELAKGTGISPRQVYPHFGEDDDQGEADIIIRRLTDESSANLTGWQPCGKGVDAAWSDTQMYLMKQPGKLKRVFSTKEDRHYFRFAGVTYDGKYVWAPVVRGNYWNSSDGLLLVIDPQTEKVWQFTAKDGLPPMSRGAAAAPLEPGKICLAGGFERGWVAIVKFDPARGKSIEIIHEARIQHAKDKDCHTQSHDADVAFRPTFMFALPQRPGRSDPPRVLLGRGFACASAVGPCLIDLERKSLSVPPEKGIYTQSWQPLDMALHDGALHWMRPTKKSVKGDKEYVAQWHVDVHRMRLAEMKKETVLKGFTAAGEWSWPEVFFYGGRIHIVGSQWWTSEDFSKPFVRMRTKCVGWQKPSNADVPGISLPFRKFWSSGHYGLLLVAPRVGVFQAEFQDGLKPPTSNRPAATKYHRLPTSPSDRADRRQEGAAASRPGHRATNAPEGGRAVQ